MKDYVEEQPNVEPSQRETRLSQVVPFDSKRSKDFQNIALLAFYTESLSRDEECFGTSRKLAEWLPGDEKPSKKWEKAVVNVLTDFLALAKNFRYNQAFQSEKRVAPVEFVFIGASSQ